MIRPYTSGERAFGLAILASGLLAYVAGVMMLVERWPAVHAWLMATAGGL